MDRELALKLYRDMLRLRLFEDTVTKMYRDGEIPGFVHCYQGEEAVAVGISACLKREDIITSTHRGHGHIIAKGCPPKEMLAELCGKLDGCSAGRGGSMHAYNMDYGLLGTNGMVGGGIGLAVGAGYASMLKKAGTVSVAYFGDGASNMGIFYESMNLASIYKLPVIFVCENNLYATSTPLFAVASNPEIATRAQAFNMPGIAVDGNDVVKVYETASLAVDRARKGDGPTLIEAKTYRTHGHHEGDQLYGTYRTKEELESWKLKCPIVFLRQRLQEEFEVTDSCLEGIDCELKLEMEEAVEYAQSSPLPDANTVCDFVFREEK